MSTRFDEAWSDLSEADKTRWSAVVEACGVDTCHPDVVADLEDFEAERKSYGSCVVATTVFICEQMLAGNELRWYPFVLEDTNFAYDHPLHLHIALFNPTVNKIVDFTASARFGGQGLYSKNEQISYLQVFLNDPTLKGRINALLKKRGLGIDADTALEMFKKSFDKGLRMNPALALMDNHTNPTDLAIH